jgi:hypothetical protein
MSGAQAASARLQQLFMRRQDQRAMNSTQASNRDPQQPTPAADAKPAPKRVLNPAAERALAEAAARRAERDRHRVDQPKETDGRGGLDPTRYGDWEINGLASDF